MTFRYPGSSVTALDRANFTIPAGAVVGVVGRSGSGKTTLLRIAAGIEAQTHGRVLLNDGSADIRRLAALEADIELGDLDRRAPDVRLPTAEDAPVLVGIMDIVAERARRRSS